MLALMLHSKASVLCCETNQTKPDTDSLLYELKETGRTGTTVKKTARLTRLIVQHERHTQKRLLTFLVMCLPLQGDLAKKKIYPTLW